LEPKGSQRFTFGEIMMDYLMEFFPHDKGGRAMNNLIEDEGGEVQRKDVFDSCNEIFSKFEDPYAREGELTLMGLFEYFLRPETDFIDDIVKESKIRLEDETAEDIFFALWEQLAVLAFGIGFAMGTWHECVEPNIKSKIEDIRSELKKKGIFYFAPKARA
jgi:hypothetical protein